ncbi:hypothetical protein H8A92_22130 [Bradyrhizobium sp. 10BB]|nr:hypothetical protein [Bradyrhizobium acaciae]
MVHAANAIAILGTFTADFRAFAARMLVVRGVDQHEVGRRPAHLRARYHQAEMRRFNMLAAGDEAMVHGRTDTGPVAGQASLNASVHFLRKRHRQLH